MIDINSVEDFNKFKSRLERACGYLKQLDKNKDRVFLYASEYERWIVEKDLSEFSWQVLCAYFVASELYSDKGENKSQFECYSKMLAIFNGTKSFDKKGFSEKYEQYLNRTQQPLTEKSHREELQAIESRVEKLYAQWLTILANKQEFTPSENGVLEAGFLLEHLGYQLELCSIKTLEEAQDSLHKVGLELREREHAAFPLGTPWCLLGLLPPTALTPQRPTFFVLQDMVVHYINSKLSSHLNALDTDPSEKITQAVKKALSASSPFEVLLEIATCLVNIKKAYNLEYSKLEILTYANGACRIIIASRHFVKQLGMPYTGVTVVVNADSVSGNVGVHPDEFSKGYIPSSRTTLKQNNGNYVQVLNWSSPGSMLNALWPEEEQNTEERKQISEGYMQSRLPDIYLMALLGNDVVNRIPVDNIKENILKEFYLAKRYGVRHFIMLKGVPKTLLGDPSQSDNADYLMALDTMFKDMWGTMTKIINETSDGISVHCVELPRELLDGDHVLGDGLHISAQGHALLSKAAVEVLNPLVHRVLLEKRMAGILRTETTGIYSNAGDGISGRSEILTQFHTAAEGLGLSATSPTVPDKSKPKLFPAAKLRN